jgi:hypothetical protein
MTEKLITPEVKLSLSIKLADLVKMEAQTKMWVNMTHINARVLADMVRECHPSLMVYLRRLIEANLVAQNNAMFALNQVNSLYKEILEAAQEENPDATRIG